MSLLPRRFKGIAKLWGSKRNLSNKENDDDMIETAPPSGEVSAVGAVNEDVSEHSTIASHLEVTSALLSMDDSPEELDNDKAPSSDDFRTDGRKVAFEAQKKVSPKAKAPPTVQLAHDRRALMQKSFSLRLPQHMDKFEPFDALCDLTPLNPRQRRRRNSIHTTGVGTYNSSSPNNSPRGAEGRSTLKYDAKTERSSHSVPTILSNSKQRRRNSLSGPIAPASPTQSSPRPRVSPGRKSPRRTSPRKSQCSSPRRMSPRNKKEVTASPRGTSGKKANSNNSNNRRAQFHRGYSMSNLHSSSIREPTPLTTLPLAPMLSIHDEAPSHPRQRRRNSLCGPTAPGGASSANTSAAQRQRRRNSKNATTAPDSPRVRNAQCPSPRTSPRTSPRISPRLRISRPAFQRGFSCSHMGKTTTTISPRPITLPPAPDLQDSLYQKPAQKPAAVQELANPSTRTAPTSSRTTVAAVTDTAPTHPRQQRRNSVSGPMSIPSTVGTSTDSVSQDLSPTAVYDRQQRRNSTGAGFSTHMPPSTPPNTRAFGLARGLSSQNITVAEPKVSPKGEATHVVPSTPPTARTAVPRSSNASTSSGSPKSIAARSVVSETSPRSITMVPSSPPRQTRGSAFSPAASPTNSDTKSPRCIKMEQVTEDTRELHHRSPRRSSCGTYHPPSPGSEDMLTYSSHTTPTVAIKSDQPPTQPRRQRRNSINEPISELSSSAYAHMPAALVNDELPNSIPEDTVEAVPRTSSFSTDAPTVENGISPSSSIPTSSAPSHVDSRPPLWGLSRRGSDRNLMESVNDVILPLDSTSRFSSGSFDVGPSHPRQAGRRQARRASMSGPTPPATPRTPMTPLTPASTMASTISSKSRTGRPSLYRRASCSSFTIQSLSPHIELVSPLSFYEEKLAVQHPSRFASGCNDDKAPPVPPQRPIRSRGSVDGSAAGSSSAGTSLNVSRRGRRPGLSRRVSSGCIGYCSNDEDRNDLESPVAPLAPAASATASAMRRSSGSRRRQFKRVASCSALGYSVRHADAQRVRNLPLASSSSALRMVQENGESLDLKSMRGSLVSTSTDNAVAPLASPVRRLPRGSSSSALRLSQQADPTVYSTIDAPPRQPRRASIGTITPRAVMQAI